MAEKTGSDPRDELVHAYADDRVLAHETVFEGPRHKHKTPEFHREIITDFHSSAPLLAWIVFRGGGKSTIAEEAIVLQAALREFRNCLIVGASEPKAQERLHAIRRQFEKNEYLRYAFDDLRGQPWADDSLELSTGITIKAMGRGQAIRGTKNEDFRPDLILVDDIEDLQSVATPEGRKKVSDWFHDELLPSGDAGLRVRMLANDMHPECIANELEKPGSGFVVKRYPWIYPDPVTGEPRAMWPDRFPLAEINRTRDRYYSQGKAGLYASNYLCRSERAEDKPFRREQFRYAGVADCPPITRTWQPVWGMFDPARSVRETAATTGHAAWSRIAQRTIVWESWAKRMLPSEIVDAIFAFNDEYHPVGIGVEVDGLNEWLMQPIRERQAKLGIVLPILPVKAPKGKFDFIRGLQFGFIAREIVFAKGLPDLEAQLVGFPSGYIDAPNALAYCQRLGATAPIYDDFTMEHVAEDIEVSASRPAWLCLNATPALVTGILVQLVEGGIRIIADWVREGEPGAIAADILKEANLELPRGSCRLVAGPQHFEKYGNAGLVQAFRRVPKEVQLGHLPDAGRHEARLLLRRMSRGMPAFRVSSRARWTLNGLAGGFARAVKNGQLMEYPEAGTYQILIEGLESFLGMMQSVADDTGAGRVNATAADGRQFFSALAHRRQEGDR